jgi:hypothetical protein
MVGVAGFYNNIYGVGFDEKVGSNVYTAFYCDDNSEDSIIRAKVVNSETNDDEMRNRYWLFSVSLQKSVTGYEPLVVDIASSNLNCSTVGQYNGVPSLEKPVEEPNGTDVMINFIHASNVNPTVVFSLGYDLDTEGKDIYSITIDDDATPVTLSSLAMDQTTQTYSSIISNMSVKKQSIGSIVDLYLNDNPGFGSADDNSTNYDRDSREFVSVNHQVPIDESNFLSDEVTLTIYSYEDADGDDTVASRNSWQLYNNKRPSAENGFNELQAGRGYWMKYDFSADRTSTFIQTLDLNSSCGRGCESNLTISMNGDLNSTNYQFTDSDVDSIVSVLNDTNVSRNGVAEVNISAVKIANNSILIRAIAGAKPTLKEEKVDGVTKNIFLNIKNATTAFSNTEDIKAGLVLGDSSVVLTSSSVYPQIVREGWNLLTLPTSTIRESVTGLMIDWTAPDFNKLQISDHSGVNVVDVIDSDSNLLMDQASLRDSARAINQAIYKAQTSGTLSTQYFNVRAIPVTDANDVNKIMLISNDRFSIAVDKTGHSSFTGKVLSLNGNDKNIRDTSIVSSDANLSTSTYGEYALVFEPNLNSQFVKDGIASFEINGHKIAIAANATLNSLKNQINGANIDVNASEIDSDIDGTMDRLLITSSSVISIRDTTYTKVYKFTPNLIGDVTVSLHKGTDLDGEVLNSRVTVAKDKNISTSSYTQNGTYLDGEVTKNYYSYIVDKDGNGTITGSETEYIVLVSQTPDLYLRESAESNNTDDSLEENLSYDKNVSTAGAILGAIHGGTFATVDLDSNGDINSSKLGERNVTANKFITDDLLVSNALITLYNAFANKETKYVPTMIIGGESNVDTGIIKWQKLSPIQQISKWYKDYNLFHTNNQKGYWVYLDKYDSNNSLVKVLIEEDIGSGIEENEVPTVTKQYIRSFDNERNTTTNMFDLDISAFVKGVKTTTDSNGDTVADESSLFVSAQLVGVSDALEALEFKMPINSSTEDSAPTVDGIREFSTEINYFDVDGLHRDMLSGLTQLTGIKITATDGRLDTDEYTIPLDVTKPKKPTLEFKTTEPRDIFITAGDVNDTVKYLIFKDRIDDINGTVIDSSNGINIPSNFIMEVNRTDGESGVGGLCQHPTFSGDNLEYASLIVLALDNQDDTQANFSDMKRINFLPMRDSHVLESTYANGSTTERDEVPTIYNSSCDNDGDLTDSTGETINSGISLKSLNGEVRIAYRGIEGEKFAQDLPNTIVVGVVGNSTVRVAEIKYIDRYVGKNFYISYNGKIYGQTFPTTADSENYLETPYPLNLVSNSGQIIGD